MDYTLNFKKQKLSVRVFLAVSQTIDHDEVTDESESDLRAHMVDLIAAFKMLPSTGDVVFTAQGSGSALITARTLAIKDGGLEVGFYMHYE